MTTQTYSAPTIPIEIRGPYIVGDRVKIRGTRQYGVVAGFNCAILVRLTNGRMEQVTHEALERNYGRRGARSHGAKVSLSKGDDYE